MPTRKVKVPVNKSAKGESFKKELEKFGRYIVGISLESLKTVGKYDLTNRTNEFYFRVNSDGVLRTRVPNKGCIELRENQAFLSKSDKLTLWSEFVRFKKDEERFVEVEIQMREEDPGKDSVLAKKNFKIKCPSKTMYEILQSKDGKTKAKFKIYAKQTSY
ncbi:hypothetical protein NEF87_005031 [Candidatus Lokiarchaeum ossiferum]|uniref:CYTH domain-containing protein n=1 Tax=Candidatus Lokiarchaeum ossiferum TaxID=2951803 RepID=A0ABY6HYZ7_9ARCH|nr:hypothetical protein NEF87_005031 [Candidatus Lokiarchaeum sp. B-35]